MLSEFAGQFTIGEALDKFICQLNLNELNIIFEIGIQKEKFVIKKMIILDKLLLIEIGASIQDSLVLIFRIFFQ